MLQSRTSPPINSIRFGTNEKIITRGSGNIYSCFAAGIHSKRNHCSIDVENLYIRSTLDFQPQNQPVYVIRYLLAVSDVWMEEREQWGLEHKKTSWRKDTFRLKLGFGLALGLGWMAGLAYRFLRGIVIRRCDMKPFVYFRRKGAFKRHTLRYSYSIS